MTEKLGYPAAALPIDGYAQTVYAKKPPWHVGFGGFFALIDALRRSHVRSS